MTQQTAPKERRTEIEGLRTVAALLVAVYHIWVGKVSGGVDVFFVVTGFFITLTVLKHVDAGRIRPLAYFGRLMRRLVPGASAVLLFAGLITLFWAPPLLAHRNFEEIIAASLSVENLYLAFNSVDYLNADDPKTPVQHFWAMSIQAQFYVLWLLVAALVLLIVKLFAANARKVMMVVFFILFVVSMGLSVWQTAVAQPFAYFVPWTRMWEFAVGGFLALLGSRLHLRGTAAGIASLGAIVVLVLTGAVLPVEGGFPGVIAAVPVLAAAAIVISTREEERWWSGTRILSWKPMVWLGSIAFGIYLWHWPLLVLYRYWYGLDAKPGLIAGPAIIIGAIVLAYLTKVLLENPVQKGWPLGGRRRPILAAGIIVAWCVAAAVPVAGIVNDAQRRELIEAYEPPNAAVAACWGYQELTQEAGACDDVLASEPLTPARQDIQGDHRWAYDCVGLNNDKRLLTCEFGPEDSDVRVALMGNSHAAVMLPDFAALAEERGWHLTTMVAQNCVWMATLDSGDCGSRVAEQRQLLTQEPFDVVFLLGNAGQGEKPDTTPVVEARFPELLETGAEVIVLEDNPRMNYAQESCLYEAPDWQLRDGKCDTNVETGYDYVDPYWEVGKQHSGDVVLIGTRDLYCRDDLCPLVIGNVIAYGDRHHITATYGVTTWPTIVGRIEAQSEVL